MPRNLKKQKIEVEEAEIIGDDKTFNKSNMQVFPPGKHVWRQQGPYCICKECPLHHAIYIGVDKVMVGENKKGEPILKSKQEVFDTK